MKKLWLASYGEIEMTDGQGFDPDVRLVPIPTEMPLKPDLTGVPSPILRSGAVEALINQNDDLMARLNVALRRNSQLEDSLQNLEKEKKIWKHQLDVLKDKLLVVQEKERLLQGRDQKILADLDRTKQELRISETRYVELCTHSKDRTRSLIERIEGHSRRIHRLLKFRSKISVGIKNLKAQRDDLKKHIGHVQFLLAQQDVRTEELQLRVDELSRYIQDQGQKSQAEKAELVDIYESKLKELRGRFTDEEREKSQLQEQLHNHNSVVSENLDLKNQLILAQREKDEVARRLNESIQDLQTQLSQVSQQAKKQLLDIHHLQETSQAQMESHRALEIERTKLLDQVESLQVLWADSQNKNEQKSVRIESLQKLNQQLSVSLNQFRKDNEHLRNKIERLESVAQHKLKALKGEFRQARIEPELGSRIDLILNEMQTGLLNETPNETAKETTSNLTIS